MVLEVPDANSKSTSDSQRCSSNQLFQELEDSGVTDYSMNCHDIVHSTVRDSATGNGRVSGNYYAMSRYVSAKKLFVKLLGGPPVYQIRPKPVIMYYQHTLVTRNFKYTNCASAFSVKAPRHCHAIRVHSAWLQQNVEMKTRITYWLELEPNLRNLRPADLL